MHIFISFWRDCRPEIACNGNLILLENFYLKDAMTVKQCYLKAIKEETHGKLGKEGMNSMTVSERRNWTEVTTQDHSVTDRIGPS